MRPWRPTSPSVRHHVAHVPPGAAERSSRRRRLGRPRPGGAPRSSGPTRCWPCNRGRRTPCWSPATSPTTAPTPMMLARASCWRRSALRVYAAGREPRRPRGAPGAAFDLPGAGAWSLRSTQPTSARCASSYSTRRSPGRTGRALDAARLAVGRRRAGCVLPGTPTVVAMHHPPLPSRASRSGTSSVLRPMAVAVLADRARGRLPTGTAVPRGRPPPPHGWTGTLAGRPVVDDPEHLRPGPGSTSTPAPLRAG